MVASYLIQSTTALVDTRRSTFNLDPTSLSVSVYSIWINLSVNSINQLVN